jgi:hypothetical protein
VLNTNTPCPKIRGKYVSHNSATKRLFRTICQAVGLTFAVKNATFKAVPPSTLYTWAKDHGPLPHGRYKRRAGEGRHPAYPREKLQKVFKVVDNLRHVKKVSPAEFGSITMDLLGPPSTVTYPNFKYSRQWVYDTCKNNSFGLHQLVPSDSLAKSAASPEETMELCSDFLVGIYEWRDHFRQHFCHGDHLQESISVLPRMRNLDEISEEKEPSKGRGGKSISRTGAEAPSMPGEGIWRNHYTVVLTSAPSGHMDIPAIVFGGKMQPAQTIQTVKIVNRDGLSVEVKVFVAHNTTHKNNQFVHTEYLKSAIIPNLPKHDCPCNNDECKSIALLQDDAKCHTTHFVQTEVYDKL